MDADPGHVIRSLRLALEMSQAEFARAAGWSPSTISSWECGRAKPSRLAFKTILAFAEERGIRYRPRTAGTALVPLSVSAAGASGTSASPGPRAAFRPLLYPDHTDHTQRSVDPSAAAAAHQAQRGIASPSAAWTHTRPDAQRPLAQPPRWSAEANFRVTLGARHDRTQSSLSRRAVEVAIVVLGFAAAFGLREPVRHLLRGATPTHVAAVGVASSAASLSAVRAPASSPVEDVAAARDEQPVATAPSLAAVTRADAAAPALAASQAPIREAPASARLESVMAIGGTGRATFRTANDAVTVVAGEWLGGQRVIAIGGDDVTLVDRAGTSHRVRVGQHTPFD